MGKRLSVVLVVFLGMAGWSLNLRAEPLAPVYIFGDSSFDVGTNHFIPETRSRADFKFYGIDFPNFEITGRFSNGFNTADEIAMLLGFEMSPLPFLSIVQNGTEIFRNQILKGVNFASGGSGLLDDTGHKRYGRVVSMTEQIEQFAAVRGNISEHLNSTADAKAMIRKSIFLFSVGSNDFFDLYYFHNNRVTEAMRQDLLNQVISNYKHHLENLRNYGARKFGILSIPPLGCLPRMLRTPTTCDEDLNNSSFEFYGLLFRLLENLTSRFPEMKFSLGNSPFVSYFTLKSPKIIGIENATSPCCGNLTRSVSCGPDSKVCKNRTSFFFWDQVHPTQYVSKLCAGTFFSGDWRFVIPMNLSELVRAS